MEIPLLAQREVLLAQREVLLAQREVLLAQLQVLLVQVQVLLACWRSRSLVIHRRLDREVGQRWFA
jgi:hypothetical protein